MKLRSTETKLKLITFTAMAILIFCTAAAAEMEKLSMVFSPEQDFVMDGAIAVEKEYFKEAGLDLNYISVKGGTSEILSTLLRKEVNGVFIASSGAVKAIEKGIDIVQVSGIGNRQFMWSVLSTSPYKTLKDLEGKKLANSPKPAGPWLALQYDLDKMGIDIDVIEMRSGGDRISALLTGHVEACSHSPQFQALYGNKLRIIHTSSISKYLWNSCGWWIKRDYLNAHPEAARRFVQGLSMARKLIQENPEEAIDIFSKYSNVRNNKFVEPFELPQFDNPPVIYQYGLQKIIDIMNEYGMLKSKLNAADYVDGRFAKVIDTDY